MMKKLFLAWQEQNSRQWFPIGCLEFDGEIYRFFYIQAVVEAIKVGFKYVYSFPDLGRTYDSAYLFHFFSNRLMSRSRPDYQRYIDSLNILPGEDDPMTVLARSGGAKATDSYEVFPYPEVDCDGIHTHFFLRGLRHRPPSSLDRAILLQPKEHLEIVYEPDNIQDSQALMLVTEDQHHLGYCPRYLSHDIFPILQQDPAGVEVLIDLVNSPPIPIQYRILCQLKAKCFPGFYPFASNDYQPLSTSDRSRHDYCSV
jgi:HIRAN domain